MSLFFCTKESENESTIYSLIIMTQIVIQLALSAKLSFTAKRFMSKAILQHERKCGSYSKYPPPSEATESYFDIGK